MLTTSADVLQVVAEAGLPTEQQHNKRATAAAAAKPTGQWKFYSSKKTATTLPSKELLSELEKRGLTLDRPADVWNRTGGRGGINKLELPLDHGMIQVVLDKHTLAEKLVGYDCGYYMDDVSAEDLAKAPQSKGTFMPAQACWGRFIGCNQQCGKPVGLIPNNQRALCRTAKHYCETCLKELRVPADRVLVVRKDAADGGNNFANGNQPVWSMAGGRKFRSFNTHAPCARKDISIVVWAHAPAVADAPAADAESPAPDPPLIPEEWLRSEEGAVLFEYVDASRDFEPKLTWAQCDNTESAAASEEDPAAAAAAAAGPSSTRKPPKRRRASPQAAQAAPAASRESSSRVQALQGANAKDRKDVLEKGKEFIEALQALSSQDPDPEISSLAAMMLAHTHASVDHFEERVEARGGGAFRSGNGGGEDWGGEEAQTAERVVHRGLGGDKAQEGEPEGGAVYCGLGVEAQEGAPHCSLSGVGEDSVPSQDGMLEALAEGLAELAMACVPPQLKQLQDEYRELYRKVFSE
jgi:hypothetical protein